MTNLHLISVSMKRFVLCFASVRLYVYIKQRYINFVHIVKIFGLEFNRVEINIHSDSVVHNVYTG